MVNQETLKKAQLVMLDELIELDRICKKYNINYWIDGGTLLGAIRHKGFIPWDDDIDVCMLDEDYKKFFKIALKEINKKYFVQHQITDKNCHVPFIKLRDRNSIFIEKEHKENEFFHQGINLDIFVMDYFDSKFQKSLVRLKKRLLRAKIDSFFSKVVNLFLKKPNNKSIIKYRYWFPQLYKYKDIFPLSEVEFEGKKFFCPNNSDVILRELYGDTYMELPPEKDRVWHSKEIRLDEKCFFEKELERTGKKLYENI